MNVVYRVELSQTERDELKGLLSAGKHAARKLKGAQTLLAAGSGSNIKVDIPNQCPAGAFLRAIPIISPTARAFMGVASEDSRSNPR
jgi:hypothetical protein